MVTKDVNISKDAVVKVITQHSPKKLWKTKKNFSQ
jgi:hypothetical protein